MELLEMIGEFIAELFSEIAVWFFVFSSWMWFAVSGVSWTLFGLFFHGDLMFYICIGFTVWWFITLCIPRETKERLW
ncbi:hypothetical protein [Paenibacillus montanisoli]|uniref:Uncharacterized protein n=1 Tax=Paenibacillus montanisoli TaxID=2081970 RepID=A0A328U3J0_9BACL|nr:hypothetical protein [Paenibacillus montanisoli]RAP76021.1 hypothetical protein DL346_11385 [Paenibacillus montanisoli]